MSDPKSVPRTASQCWWLLHAAGAGPGSMAGLAAALASSGRAIRCPGLDYGADEGVPVRAYARALAADLASFHRAMDGESVSTVVFGHSMGGLAALAAAVTGPPPDLLVLYEPIVVGLLRDDDEGDARARRWDADIVARLRDCVAAGDPETGVRTFVEAWNEVRWARLPATIRARLIASGAALAREAAAASTFPLVATDLEGLPLPVLVLQGSSSPELTHRMTARLCDALPKAELRVVEGAGHMAPVLQADRIAALLGEVTWPD